MFVHGAPTAHGPAAVPAAPPRARAAHSPRTGAASQVAEPIDLLETSGGGVLKRIGPPAAATVLLTALLFLWWRRT